jgi:hypothetical protein
MLDAIVRLPIDPQIIAHFCSEKRRILKSEIKRDIVGAPIASARRQSTDILITRNSNLCIAMKKVVRVMLVRDTGHAIYTCQVDRRRSVRWQPLLDEAGQSNSHARPATPVDPTSRRPSTIDWQTGIVENQSYRTRIGQSRRSSSIRTRCRCSLCVGCAGATKHA